MERIRLTFHPGVLSLGAAFAVALWFLFAWVRQGPPRTPEAVVIGFVWTLWVLSFRRALSNFRRVFQRAFDIRSE